MPPRTPRDTCFGHAGELAEAQIAAGLALVNEIATRTVRVWCDEAARGNYDALRGELTPGELWGYVRHAWSQLQWGELEQPAAIRLNIADTLERAFRDRIAQFAAAELTDDDS